MYQEAREKVKTFFGRTSIFEKIPTYLFRKFQAIFVRKTLYPGPHMA